MKKLFFTLILMLSVFAGSAEINTEIVVDATVGSSYSSYCGAFYIDAAGDADGNRSAICDFYPDKDEIVVTVYGPSFHKIKTMVFKGFSRIVSFYPKPYDCTVCAFYNWFVKNDKWCVVMVDKSGQEVVVDEDGNIVGKLPALCGTEIYFDGFSDGKIYLAQYTDMSEDHFNIITFTGSNSIETVKVAEMRAYPNPLRAGQVFTVELPRMADNHTLLVVTDMNGRQVARQRIESGADKVVLSNARFGHGQYIYTIIYGDGTSESGKLLAE